MPRLPEAIGPRRPGHRPDSEIVDVTVNGLRVDVRTHGATGGGVIDDRAAVQAAINEVAANGGGVVFFPSIDGARGRYKIASDGGTIGLPGDDGTCHNQTTIPAETPGTMPYGLLRPNYVALEGDSEQGAVLLGAYDYVTGGIDTNQRILLAHTSGHGRLNHIRRLSIEDAFIGFFVPGGTSMSRSVFDDLAFRRCVFPMITDTLERNDFRHVHMSLCWAGLANGMWRFRRNAPQEASWADKNRVGRIDWTDPPWQAATTGLLDRLDAIDAFYDLIFYKSQNNATRGGPPDPNDMFANNPFIGVCGIPICWMARYGRGSNTNRIEGPVFSRGAIRAHMLIGHANAGYYGDHFVENFGWADAEARTMVFGVDRPDPYTASKARGLLVFFPLALGGNFAKIGSVRPEKCNALKTIWSANNLAYSWDGVKTTEGSGVIDEQQTRGHFIGAVTVLGALIPNADDTIDLGAEDRTFDTAYINEVLSGEQAAGHTGPAWRMRSGPGGYQNYNPGGAWQNHDYFSDTLTQPFTLTPGAGFIIVQLNRGATKIGGGVYAYAGSGPNAGGWDIGELVPFTADTQGGYTAGLTVTIEAGGVVKFAFTSNYNNVHTGELVVSLIQTTGFFEAA